MGSHGRLALLLLSLAGLGCGARYDPGPVGPTPTGGEVAGGPPPRRPAAARAPDAPPRMVLVGQMCPASAGGRAGVEPWFVRETAWADEPAATALAVARGGVRQLVVLGHDGRRVGLFAPLGMAEVEGGQVAAGGYAGASPCAVLAPPGQPSKPDPACVRVQRECGVAIGEIRRGDQAPVGEDPEPIALATGGACVEGQGGKAALAIDVDGDGKVERFPLVGLVDEGAAPAEELVATADSGPARCEATFSRPELLPARHPKGFLGLDLLAVVDADGDGRREVVFQLRYAGRRSVAIYAGRDSASRLERVGEALVLGGEAAADAKSGGDGGGKPR